ncbi:hypothetical protein LAZ67_8001369 [Cordylochernes scorpioides]|uniref:Uncharacterized protein n=1 Tax=Cordylochernes scorpioides TaxID=51811 RepID=A0ABY6KTT7_9ARAC|nr:hypothetical protein LAZ67_8001369 [Cordylochernes scorpioides]
MDGYSWTSGRREAFVFLNEGLKIHQLPARIEIKSKGIITPAYITHNMKCSKCKRQGHRRANFSKFVPESTALEADSWKPSIIPMMQPSLHPALHSNNVVLTPTAPCPAPKEALLKPKQKPRASRSKPSFLTKDSNEEPAGSQEEDTATFNLLAFKQLNEALKNAPDSLFETPVIERVEALLGEASLKIVNIPSGDLWREWGKLNRELVEYIKCLSTPRAEDENYIARASRILRFRLEAETVHGD